MFYESYLDVLWKGKLQRSCCFVGCCFQDLFKITRSIIIIHIVHLFSSTDTPTTWKWSHFILSDIGFPYDQSLPIAVHAFSRHMFISLSRDGILLHQCINFFTNIIFHLLESSVFVYKIFKEKKSGSGKSGERDNRLNYVPLESNLSLNFCRRSFIVAFAEWAVVPSCHVSGGGEIF